MQRNEGQSLGTFALPFVCRNYAGDVVRQSIFALDPNDPEIASLLSILLGWKKVRCVRGPSAARRSPARLASDFANC
jgi:hypothetical protein